ncbi:Neurochondrin [Lamellibrachia satsuma]|nr:Neurochondrin [Lamellibrachia satsuma]
MSRSPLNKCLTALRSSESDSERLAALLLVTKLIKSESSNRDTRMDIFKAVGFKFLIRLLRTDKVPDGCSPSAYKSLAVTLLTCFCSEPDLVSNPEMLKCIPLFNSIITTNPPGGNTEEQAMVTECYECLSCIAAQRTSRSSLIRQRCVSALCTVFTQRYYHYERSWCLLEYLLSECGSSTWTDNVDGLQMLLTKLATDFRDAQDKEVFTLCVFLHKVLASMNKEQTRELKCNEWVEDIYTTLLQLLQSRLGQKERETSLGLGSLLVDLLGMEWALEKPGKSRTFVLLLVHLSCVEVRMTLEDLPPAQIASSGSLLSACYSVLENIIAHMTSDCKLSLDESQVEQVHAAMVGAFNAVLFFLSQYQVQTDDQSPQMKGSQVALYPVVLASIRVLGSWIAEETLALKKEVTKLLPFLLEISEKTVQDVRHGESVTADKELPTETISMETDDVASGDNMTVSTTDSIVVTPPGEVLKFLLPGLCHLTAEDKARRVLLENNVHVTLGRYFHYRWQLFTSGETLAQESEVALTTLCGVFMNLCVLERNLVSSHPVFTELLGFIVSALPSIAEATEHVVLSFNLLVMSLMLARHQVTSHSIGPADCNGIFTTGIQLLSRAHTRKSLSGKKAWLMGISEGYEPYWDDLSELWFIGMQTLSACVSLFPSLATIVLQAGWLPSLLKLLLDVKGRGVTADVVTSYQGFLCSLTCSSILSRQVIHEKGGLQMARLYEMEELERILNN